MPRSRARRSPRGCDSGRRPCGSSCWRSIGNRASTSRRSPRRRTRRCRRRPRRRARSRRRRVAVRRRPADDLVQQPPSVVVEFPRHLAVVGMIEDGGEAPLHLPGGEEEGPVDERHQAIERDVGEDAPAEERRARAAAPPSSRGAARWRGPSAIGRRRRAFGPPYFWRSSSCSARFSRSNSAPRLGIEQPRDHAADARRVGHVDRRTAVLGRDLRPPCAAGSSSRRRSAAGR